MSSLMQVLLYIADVRSGLFRSQQIGDDGVDHRQQTVVYPGVPIPWVQQVIDPTVGMMRPHGGVLGMVVTLRVEERHDGVEQRRL
jgi:hypothetical protein